MECDATQYRKQNMSMDAQINFRTSSEIKQKIVDMANKRGIKPSQMMNEIVEFFLDNVVTQDSKAIDLKALYDMVNLQAKKIEVHEQQIALLAKK